MINKNTEQQQQKKENMKTKQQKQKIGRQLYKDAGNTPNKEIKEEGGMQEHAQYTSRR